MRAVEPTEHRALARISSDLFGCVEVAPLPQHVEREWTRLSNDPYVCGGNDGSMPGVYEVARVEGGAVQREGASMYDAVDTVRQR